MSGGKSLWKQHVDAGRMSKRKSSAVSSSCVYRLDLNFSRGKLLFNVYSNDVA